MLTKEFLEAGISKKTLSAYLQKVYFVKSELLELGLVEFRTVHVRRVRMYNKERTICDMIRNRSTMDINILNEGVKRYIGSKDKNVNPQILLRNYMME